MIRQGVRAIYGRTITSTLTTQDTFQTPIYDFDSLTLKVYNNTWATPTNGTLNIYLQTSDDGFVQNAYDLVAVGTISAAIATASALFYTIPVNGGDGKAITNISQSAVGSYVGSVTGLPVLGNTFRVIYQFTGVTATSTVGTTINLVATNQSPHA